MVVHITVVNSDPSFLDLMKMLLTDEGMEFIGLHTSEDALRQIREKPPDVVVLDIRLEHPEAGWNLLQFSRLHPATRNIPVIVCSADTIFLRSKAQQLEEKGYYILEKPFDIEELLDMIRKALSAPTV